MKVCPKCGEEYRDIVSTCSDCGVKLVNYDDPRYEDDYQEDEYYQGDYDDIEEEVKNENNAFKPLDLTASIVMVLVIICRIVWIISAIAAGASLIVILEGVISCLIAFAVLAFISALCEFFEDIHIMRLQGYRRK